MYKQYFFKEIWHYAYVHVITKQIATPWHKREINQMANNHINITTLTNYEWQKLFLLKTGMISVSFSRSGSIRDICEINYIKLMTSFIQLLRNTQQQFVSWLLINTETSLNACVIYNAHFLNLTMDRMWNFASEVHSSCQWIDKTVAVIINHRYWKIKQKIPE